MFFSISSTFKTWEGMLPFVRKMNRVYYNKLKQKQMKKFFNKTLPILRLFPTKSY